MTTPIEYKVSLEIPPRRWLWIAIVVVLSVTLACFLYRLGGKSTADYAAKLAEYVTQGAVVGVLFTLIAKSIEGINLRLR